MNTWIKRTVAILGTFLMLPAPMASAAEPSIDEFVRTYVEAHMSEARVPGMVFVHTDGRETTTLAFGTADFETERPMSPATPLRLGSISKPITATIALELESAGVIDLDAPADRYLDVDLSDAYGPASTIRQLLQHRGGYPDAIVGSHHADPADATDLDEWISELPKRSIPNDVVASYTSVGYTVAGAALAGATGESFGDLARRVVFDPLGMSDATFAQPPPPDVATGHRWTDSGFESFALDAAQLVPGAGLTATAEDIGRFMRAMVSDSSPLAPSTIKGLLEPAGPAPGFRGFTTGLTEWRYGERTVLYHEGNGMGTTNRMVILPDEGVGIFTAINAAAMIGMGDPSEQNTFARELHREIVERFYPTSDSMDVTSHLDGQAVPTAPSTGIYVSTRVDTSSPLRLEALVTQRRLETTTSGITFSGRPYAGEGGGTYLGTNGAIRFLEGPDGVTYATTGGTGAYRQAAWWETMTPNAALLGGALLVMVLGLAIGMRPASARMRTLMLGTTSLAITFIGLLGFGLSTVEVMELFTGLPTDLRLAQVAALGLGAASVLGAISALSQRDRLSHRVLGSALAISLAGLALTGWALMWRVLPI